MLEELYDEYLMKKEERGPIALEEQVRILEELGIECSMRQAEECQAGIVAINEMLEEEDIDPISVDYVALLEYIGWGTEEEDRWVPSSDKVYTFDSEVANVMRMYIPFLNGIVAISNGEFEITEMVENRVEGEKQEESVHTISFKYNGHPYTFEGIVETDWMDCSIIEFFNDVLKQEDNPKRLLCMGNNSQGLIVMYNTIEWAKQFTKQTLELLSLSGNLVDSYIEP